jgi:hypothetical protein
VSRKRSSKEGSIRVAPLPSQNHQIAPVITRLEIPKGIV